ncbi:alanine aminotransferase 2 [Hibiscus syriacus]|uniref:Alanine aminotransferase 2 n=1 Tax=Hibiscus syriacus TaxID=106335 RepID=A0A6A3C2R3_HIBSY|nr:alanine aminotransferase 2 [Hibiscus syriacus]
MKENLKFEERSMKWKVLEMPLKELHRIFKEGEIYIKEILETKNWWLKAVSLYQNSDCVDLHIHNLLSCIPVVIEAIESAAKLSDWEQDEMQKKKRLYSNKYHKEWIDSQLFQWKFAKQYLVTQDFCDRIDSFTAIEGEAFTEFDPTRIEAVSYVEAVASDISSLFSLSHPNILHFLCGITDDERKECLLIMELNKSLYDCLKETCSPKKRSSFCLPVAVDLMLQIARGMEYLHSNKIYHGDLNPSSIHVKLRGMSPAGFMQAKVSGFGLSSILQKSTDKNHNEPQLFIWHAPEVLEEQEQPASKRNFNLEFTEKADVYSFGMICFQLLTGKVPFEDSHLQGDKWAET